VVSLYLASWPGRCEPENLPWVFFLVRSVESWICLKYPSFLALESLNCWQNCLEFLPCLGVPLWLLPGGNLLKLHYPYCLTAQRKRVIYLDPQVVTLSWEIKGQSNDWFTYCSVRIKAQAKTIFIGLQSPDFYMVLSRVYNFYKCSKVHTYPVLIS